MTHNLPPARVLDLTRLMRRAGRVLTGIDRVELAYLKAVLAASVPAFALIRTQLGYILLDQAGMEELVTLLCSSVSSGPTAAAKKRIWRMARQMAVGRVPPALLGYMLRRHVPRGAAYLNIGHANLTDRVLRTMKDVINAPIAGFIHDVIPLEFPDYQRDSRVAWFSEMIARVARYSDLIIYNSQDTARRAALQMAEPPASIVAHLGTDVCTPAPLELPQGLPPETPFFVCVGTIEPRKNHAFLLDIWEEMGKDAPALVIAGSRGWKNEAVFARLDALPKGAPIYEVSGLSDGALAALMKASSGCLFPSHAEGYGLPAIEAVALGCPVIVNDLDVFREVLADIPVYVSVSDRYLWIDTVKKMSQVKTQASEIQNFHPPTWADHFKIVLRLI